MLRNICMYDVCLYFLAAFFFIHCIFYQGILYVRNLPYKISQEPNYPLQ